MQGGISLFSSSIRETDGLCPIGFSEIGDNEFVYVCVCTPWVILERSAFH